ncbi:hypothetical protein SPI_07479 [Niveomyces insectorum RCEF 264]|uniref:Late endosomal/lysosomal adaptor and MAPK and MTOR activator-domain-containing protein n=1 Tax=Niveomyces insectorum RCEF 264 TaxID=1081102 RepID=A0A167PWH8_9HYPO|nr:hypothetical protein SPI_07479 [Niveomyces insectorum RCEF 264]
MGNCSSCIGGERKSVYEEDDDSRLLFGDADGAHYGSFGEPTLSSQDDAQEVQRELEALQRIVARTSNNMVDVFEIVPQGSNPPAITTPYGLGISDTRISRYQSLLSKLAVTDNVDSEAQFEEYPTVEDTIEVYRDAAPPKTNVAGPFAGSFADAAKVR